MGDEHDGLPALAPQSEEQEVHFIAREGIQGAERLVHEQDRGVLGQCAHDGGPLLHSPRELPRKSLLEPAQAGRVQKRPNPRPVHRRPLDLEGKHDVLKEVPPGEQIRLLEDQPDLPGARAAHGLGIEEDLPARQGMQSRHRPQQSRLPTAARTEETQELPRSNVHGETVERRDPGGSGLVDLRRLHDADLGRRFWSRPGVDAQNHPSSSGSAYCMNSTTTPSWSTKATVTKPSPTSKGSRSNLWPLIALWTSATR